MKKTSVLILVSTLLLLILLPPSLMIPCSSASLTSLESWIVAQISGTSVYNYDLELERIALDHTLSKYSYRSAGSSGANATADWIINQFESFGLEAYKEPYRFTTWNVLSKPTLIIDEDGNPATTSDQTVITSFESEHYSWPTPPTGVFADLVVLPLPPAASRDELKSAQPSIDQAAWDAIDTTGKIVLIGREILDGYVGSWRQVYKDKLKAQTPAAVVYTWWYDWMSYMPPIHHSLGGRPMGNQAFYWDWGIPVGFVDYYNGMWIRNREGSIDVSAEVNIEAVIGSGPHYNVVGKLTGYIYPNKYVIVSSHYDTVTCCGFSDNGAGTAGVMELAKVFAQAKRTGLLRPACTILFVPFADEEIGMVGSIHYVMQHKAEMNDILALINLDTLGSDTLAYTETTPGPYFDLDELLSKSAQDLGIATETFPAGGDDTTFREPASLNDFLQRTWGLDANIGDATPVNSSLSLMSPPGTWIHTSYDNSTSTATLNWCKPDNLGNQIKVAALSLARIVLEVVSATIEIDPGTLNLQSKGKWICCYIEFPKGYDVNDIDVSSILLNNTILAGLRPTSYGDHDRDGIPDLMVKFDRQAVMTLILANCQLAGRFVIASLVITGKLGDGPIFEGSSTIKIEKP